MALPPQRYEALRDEQRLAVDKEQEKQDWTDRQARKTAKPERTSPDIDHEHIRQQAVRQVALEREVKFERQKNDYAFRQREKEERERREAGSLEYMKTHHPLEYDRSMKDRERQQQWMEPSRAAPETREKSDDAQAREPRERVMSDRARALVEKTRERDALEREDRDDRER